MLSRLRITRRWLVLACVLSSVVASVSSAMLLAFYPWIFPALGVPLPHDARAFVVETSMSMALALVLLVQARRRVPDGAILGVAILGKALDAAATFAFCALGRVPSSFYAGAYLDAFLVILFLLYWLQAPGDELLELQMDVFEGILNPERANEKRALVLGVVADEGAPALDRIVAGLKSRGYAVDRALVPARVAPLAVPAGRDWDLVVVEAPVRLFGVAAPVEAMLDDPTNRWIFQGRDAAVLVVSRGARRRALATMLRRLERLGANVVAARAFAPNGAAPEAESLGQSLADRARTRPHWTLLLDTPSGSGVPASTRRPKETRTEDRSA